MNTDKDGGNAFPIPGLQEDPDFNGLSVRDYFAAKAMQGFSQTVRDLGGADQAVARGEFDVCARFAYMLADAMLKARGET